MSSLIDQLRDSSPLFGGNAPFIEDLYERYLQDPDSIPDNWREYFSDLQVQQHFEGQEIAHEPVRDSFARLAKQPPAQTAVRSAAWDSEEPVIAAISAEHFFAGVQHVLCARLGPTTHTRGAPRSKGEVTHLVILDHLPSRSHWCAHGLGSGRLLARSMYI